MDERVKDGYYGFCALSLFNDNVKETYIRKFFINGELQSHLLCTFGYNSHINSAEPYAWTTIDKAGNISINDCHEAGSLAAAIAPACTIG